MKIQSEMLGLEDSRRFEGSRNQRQGSEFFLGNSRGVDSMR